MSFGTGETFEEVGNSFLTFASQGAPHIIGSLSDSILLYQFAGHGLRVLEADFWPAWALLVRLSE